MTKQELQVKVIEQLGIINGANVMISSYVNDYIRSLPYKIGDKVSCCRCDVCWISSIVPQKGYRGYTGEIEVIINPSNKDGNRSKRYYLIDSWEVDTIKKID